MTTMPDTFKFRQKVSKFSLEFEMYGDLQVHYFADKNVVYVSASRLMTTFRVYVVCLRSFHVIIIIKNLQSVIVSDS